MYTQIDTRFCCFRYFSTSPLDHPLGPKKILASNPRGKSQHPTSNSVQVMVNSANSWEIQKKSYLKKKLFHPIKSKKCPLKSQGFGCLVAEEDAEAATRVAPQVQGRARDVRKIRKSSNPKPKQTWKNTSYTGKI